MTEEQAAAVVEQLKKPLAPGKIRKRYVPEVGAILYSAVLPNAQRTRIDLFGKYGESDGHVQSRFNRICRCFGLDEYVMEDV